MTAEMPSITIQPIGRVVGGRADLQRSDWSRVRSQVRLHDDLAPALLGLQDYTHVIVVAWLHLIPGELRERLQAYPGGDERLPLQGALALRGGARPNPIAVTVCRLRGVREATLEVEGLDLVEGTPVLDVKPYIPIYDAVKDARIPRWAQG